jgi:hypothetical protein
MMANDSRELLSLVAAGRMSAEQAERWLVARRADREEIWIFAALVVAVLAWSPAAQAVLQWLHVAAVWLGQI